MKTEDAIILAAAAAIAFFLLRKGSGSSAQGSSLASGANFAPKTEAGDAGFGNVVAVSGGWRYYDTGYAKDANGAIYYQGMRLT